MTPWKSNIINHTPTEAEMRDALEAIFRAPAQLPTYVMGRKEWEWWKAHPEQAKLMFGREL